MNILKITTQKMKKSLMENFIFCAVNVMGKISKRDPT